MLFYIFLYLSVSRIGFINTIDINSVSDMLVNRPIFKQENFKQIMSVLGFFIFFLR